MQRVTVAIVAIAVLAGLDGARAEEDRAAVSAPAGTVVERVHAVGAQIYVCKVDAGGALAWSFREPVATLVKDGKTVGRHFAGPTWEMADGSSIVGRLAAQAPGATPADIAWLKLAVVAHAGRGALDEVATVQRLETVGGGKSGPCPVAGTLVAEPYAADYVFSRP